MDEKLLRFSVKQNMVSHVSEKVISQQGKIEK